MKPGNLPAFFRWRVRCPKALSPAEHRRAKDERSGAKALRPFGPAPLVVRERPAHCSGAVTEGR
ncbi:hypothetical protein HRbin17_00233 [bacterium HR17]|uniref:Uncharacterized protein n=1 Tax=Candidatus Fervidibacter japonicus TaxID=2035412 RepID=A0A2H5X9B4_9BACT|nr:hypothetical protein HRbin17_00233 [bacterium HR17]